MSDVISAADGSPLRNCDTFSSCSQDLSHWLVRLWTCALHCRIDKGTPPSRSLCVQTRKCSRTRYLGGTRFLTGWSGLGRVHRTPGSTWRGAPQPSDVNRQRLCQQPPWGGSRHVPPGARRLRRLPPHRVGLFGQPAVQGGFWDGPLRGTFAGDAGRLCSSSQAGALPLSFSVALSQAVKSNLSSTSQASSLLHSFSKALR